MTTIEVWYAILLFVLTSGSYLTRLSPRRLLHHLGVGLLMASTYGLVNTPFPASNRIFFACWLGGPFSIHSAHLFDFYCFLCCNTIRINHYSLRRGTMEVLYMYAGLCILGGVVGVFEVRRSFEKHWELRAGLFAFLLIASVTLLTTVDWEKVFRIGGAVGIVLAYLAGVMLGCKSMQTMSRPKKETGGTPKKIDYPLTGDDFCVSGYEDAKGNRVPLGS